MRKNKSNLFFWLVSFFAGILSLISVVSLLQNLARAERTARVNSDKLADDRSQRQLLVDYWAKIKDVIANQDIIVVKYELEGAGILIGLLTASGLVYIQAPKIAGLLAISVSIVSMIFMQASIFYGGFLERAVNTAIEIERELFGQEALERKGLTYKLSKHAHESTFLGIYLGRLITYTTLGGIALLALFLGFYYFGWWPLIFNFFGNILHVLSNFVTKILH